jgi:hypothetical protein
MLTTDSRFEHGMDDAAQLPEAPCTSELPGFCHGADRLKAVERGIRLRFAFHLSSDPSQFSILLAYN